MTHPGIVNFRAPAMGRQHGLSLLELMISITIGAVLMTGLVATFNQSGESRRELEKTGTLIENGRYAVNLVYDDLRHAGFYGYYYDLGDPPATAPDPCEVTVANLPTGMSMPIQGFRAANLTTRPDISATTCDDKGLFTNANLKAGSDILVIRRADTAEHTGNTTANVIYMESNARDVNFIVGSGSPATTTLLKYPSKAGNTTAAEVRRYRVHVYFVAPCSFGSGTNGVCQTGDDDTPTLKRLELSAVGSATAMEIVPLVEGVEYFKVRYGIDNSPTTANSVTGVIGDGVPDSYTTNPASLADWANVVTSQAHFLVRTTVETQEYTDTKTYAVAGVSGGVTAGPFDDHYRRRVYSTEALSMNMAGRREVPK